MGTVAVIGEEARIRGFALVGALILAAEDAAGVRDAWQRLPAGVEVVILTAAAHHVLADRDPLAIPPVVAVMPPGDPR